VERRNNGQSNRYTLPITGQESLPVQDDGNKANRPRTFTPGGQEPLPLPAKNLCQNKIDSLNKRGAASPPDGESFALTPPTTPTLTPTTTGTRTFVGLWISLFHEKTGRDLPNRGQVGNTIKRLSASFSAADLDGAIRSWFTQDRRDYGVGLFKMKLEGGDRELLKRGQTFQDDPQALRNGVALAAMAEKTQ
jgi:hypothetical protein